MKHFGELRRGGGCCKILEDSRRGSETFSTLNMCQYYGMCNRGTTNILCRFKGGQLPYSPAQSDIPPFQPNIISDQSNTFFR